MTIVELLIQARQEKIVRTLTKALGVAKDDLEAATNEFKGGEDTYSKHYLEGFMDGIAHTIELITGENPIY